MPSQSVLHRFWIPPDNFECRHTSFLQVRSGYDRHIPQWSPQNRPTVVRAKPANGRGRGLSCFTRGFLRRQVYFRAPTSRTAFENMTVMEEAIEHGGDGCAVTQQFAPVVDGSI